MTSTQAHSPTAIFLAGIFALLLPLIAGGCRGKPAPAKEVIRPVKTMVLDAAHSTVPRNYPATVNASEKAVMAFKVSGPLLEFPVTEGQQVTRDTLLARIDPRDYKVNLAHAEATLAEAKATLEAMKVARPEDIKLAEAQVRAARATFHEANMTVTRNEPLVRKGVVTEQDFELFVASRNVAKAKMDAAIEQLNKAKLGARKEDIEAMEAKISSLASQVDNAKNAVADTQLKAPFDGIVAETYVENFENIIAGQKILLLNDLKNIDVVVSVPETVVARAHKLEEEKKNADRVVVRFEADPTHEYELTIKKIATEADRATQTYRLTLTMPAPEKINIFPGMTCTVIHYTPIGGDAAWFAVPAASVFDDGGKSYVWTIDSAGVSHRREVKVGEMSGKYIRVLEGLKKGETIAISGVHYLHENMKVRKLGMTIGEALK